MAGIGWQLEHFTIKNKHTYNNKHYEVLNNYTTIIVPFLPLSISCSKKVLPLWYTSLESARTGGVNPEKYIISIGVCLCVSITYQWLVCQYQDQRRTPGLCQYFPAPTAVFQCQSLIIRTDRRFIHINLWHSTFLSPSYPGLLLYHHHTASVDGHQGRNSRILKEGGALHKRTVIERGLL